MRRILLAVGMAFLEPWAVAERQPKPTRHVVTATVSRFDGVFLTVGPWDRLAVTDRTPFESVDPALTRADLAEGRLVTVTVLCGAGNPCRAEKVRLMTDVRLR